jgi:hypothetical protein
VTLTTLPLIAPCAREIANPRPRAAFSHIDDVITPHDNDAG